MGSFTEPGDALGQAEQRAITNALVQIGKRAIVEMVETEGIGIDDAEGHAYDMRPALDTQRHADEEVELVRTAVETGLLAGVLESVSVRQPMVVRVAWSEA